MWNWKAMSLRSFFGIARRDTKNQKSLQDGVAFNLRPVGN